MSQVAILTEASSHDKVLVFVISVSVSQCGLVGILLTDTSLERRVGMFRISFSIRVVIFSTTGLKIEAISLLNLPSA